MADVLNMDYYRTTEKNSNRLGIVLHYKSNFTPSNEGEVKLDIGYLIKCNIFPPVYNKISQLHPDDGLRNLKVLIAHPCEIWAGKALALVYKSINDPKPEEAAELYSMFIARHLYDISKMEERIDRKEESYSADLNSPLFADINPPL